MRSQILVFLGAIALTGCASGGGSSSVPPSPSSGSSGTPVPPSFVIGAPELPPVPGVNPVASGSATINGATPPATGTAFGLEETVYAISSTGLTANNNLSQSATITYTGSGYQLLIPGDGVSFNVMPGDSSGTTSTGTPIAVQLTEWTYVLGGFWFFGSTGNVTLSTFLSGYLAPQSAIPFLGSASYASTNGVVGVVHTIVNGSYEPVPLTGDANLTANFGTNQITGMFSNIVATNSANQSFPWNSISLTGVISSNNFHGTTQVANVPGNVYGLKSNAAGSFYGGFYGPQATEIGALWTAYDGTSAATGVVEADGSPTPPSQPVNPPAAASDFLGRNVLFTFNANSILSTVAAPAPASNGNSPSPPVLASTGGPTFANTIFSGNPPAAGTAFPLTQTAVQVSSSAVSVDDNTNAGGATLTIEPYPIGPGTNLHVNVPSLGISEDIVIGGIPWTLNQTGVLAANSNLGAGIELVFTGLNYTVFGTWNGGVTGSNQQDLAGFVFGYQTPANSMPTSGTASYTGKGAVNGFVLNQGQSAGNPVALNGDASFNVDFAAEQLSGTFTNMTAYAHNANNINSDEFAYPWNIISVSASIASGKSTFGGSTTVTSQPASPYALQNGATGHINGGFYGPAANELGAVWTLSNGNGTGSAIGAVGATKQ